MNVKDVQTALSAIEETRMISYDVVVDALKDALAKAARKHLENPDAVIEVIVNDEGDLNVYLQRKVVDTEIEDDDLEVSLEDAREIKPDAQLGDMLNEEIMIEDFGRSTVSLVKNVILQQIKEASKKMVYDEYVDQIDEMVTGTVQTVEDKFVLIDLGKTLAIMPKSEQIPGEKYHDGQRIKVVIKSVNKDTKGAQVVVSRASANLVKRLFESSVTEIYDGTVEIKAIARVAGERTKMAVYSKNPNVDPIGACIGPRGSRIIDVIEEITQSGNPLSHENIDIFEWDDNFVEFVKNVMKPAEILAVLPTTEDEKELLIVVDDDKLSLAIGKKGINARLAVKLLNRKVDIKTKSQVEEEGIDWVSESMAFAARQEALRRQQAIEKLNKEAEEKAKELEEKIETIASETEAIEEYEPEFEVELEEETVEEIVEPVVETVEVEEPVKEEPAEEEETSEETTKRRRPNLEKIKASEYISKYEELADTKKNTQQASTNKRKKNTKEEQEEAELKKRIEELKAQSYDIKPEYSEEELEEFNSEDEHWYDDDDYDDYEEYYDDNI